MKRKKVDAKKHGTTMLVSTFVALAIVTTCGYAETAVRPFPAVLWTLYPSADVSTTNEFNALRIGLEEIVRNLTTEGRKEHETLTTLPEEHREAFVRSLYVGYLTKGPESAFGFGISESPTNSIVVNRRKWKRLHSDEEVAAGRLRNRMARAAFVSCLQSSATSMPTVVQCGMFSAARSLWIRSEPKHGVVRPAEARREEDGVPSVESLLRWFAENELLCDEVRTEARRRLNALEPQKDSDGEAEAHQENDRAVMAAYGFSTKMTESECVAARFDRYRALAEKEISK